MMKSNSNHHVILLRLVLVHSNDNGSELEGFADDFVVVVGEVVVGFILVAIITREEGSLGRKQHQQHGEHYDRYPSQESVSSSVLRTTLLIQYATKRRFFGVGR